MGTTKNTEGTIAVDKEELSRIIKEAVQKKLNEGKFKPFTKKDDKPSGKGEKSEKNSKADKKEDKKEMSDFMKKKLREAVKTVLEALDMPGMDPSMAETGTPPMGAQGAMAPTMEAGKPTMADPHAAEELMLYLENDFELWEGNQKKSIEKNLAQKMKKGRYDSALAPKIWMYLVEAAAKKYIKDHGTPGDRIDSVFNKATRMQVADRLAKQFEGEIKTGEKDLESLIAAI